MNRRPRLLIEDWLPITELGIESRRESAPIPGQFPKLKTLHVWWARRPLAATAGVVLASVMPVWSEELRARFETEPEVGSESEYRRWFLRLCGILGDPVAAKRQAEANKAADMRTTANPYGYKPAFKNSPTTADLRLLHRILDETWGSIPNTLDPTAGGGSIPFEAIRYGFPTHANDLNPVACAVLRASLEAPSRFGGDLTSDVRHWGELLTTRIRERLLRYFPSGADEQVANYVFARTVACPRTGKPVPLSPNWWLSKEAGKEYAVRLLTKRDGRDLDLAEFEVVSRAAAKASNPDRGTLAGGDAISPWDDLAIDSSYIKDEARNGRMGEQLYAVRAATNDKRFFRAPTEQDLNALADAEKELARLMPEWEQSDVVPTEEFPDGNDTRPIQYGMPRWRDLFAPRQLLVHGVFVEEYRKVVSEVRAAINDVVRADAILGLLSMMLGKGVNWNGRLASWDASRSKMRSVFERHDFAMKWSFGEFEGASELYPWALDQLVAAFEELARLLVPSDEDSLHGAKLAYPVPGKVEVSNLNAGSLAHLDDESVSLICIDPPYGANVMYAELADYFYVWEKRAAGHVWPDLFKDDLTDKQNEAVANFARFAVGGRRKKELAHGDYEAKMHSVFAECLRVLRLDGVMTVMFTHTDPGAWDALGAALMEAGFVIEASWPVNTESEQSLHQAKKNAAASTIMLVCRKRESDAGGEFFEDLEPEVRNEARRALLDVSAKGVSGVDMLLSTYGPALSVISSRWPVYSSEADPVTGRSRLLRPEVALDSARAEVTRLQRQRLVGRDQRLDPITDFVLVSWDTFQAREFPFDDARRMALAVGGLSVDDLAKARVLSKKSGTVTLTTPAHRVRREADLEAGLSGVYPEATAFTVALDGVHTAAYIADVDGLAAAKSFLDRAGLSSDARFLATLQGLVNAIPRTRIKGEWVVPEAETLDRLSAAYFPDIELPQEPEVPSFEQPSLLGEE